MAREFVARFFGGQAVRDSGEPTSSNGASSLHLVWDTSQKQLDEVSATFELLVEPVVDRLYFWALQAGFTADGVSMGAAHLGLQWNPRYPDRRAVNWGGYDDSGQLAGSTSPLPSATGNANTRDYPWRTAVRYRFSIASPAPGSWRGMVTDLTSGEVAVVRDLYSPGTHLTAPMVWTEAFCRCDAPPVVARWSEFQGKADGVEVPMSSVTVNYQSYDRGGCTNTTAQPDGDGVLQLTGTSRRVALGQRIQIQ